MPAAIRSATVWVIVTGLISGSTSAVEMELQPPSYQTASDILYRTEADVDEYARDRCRLDVYYPTGVKDFPTVVWFHGGGLTQGDKFIPTRLQNQGIGVVAANYRLSPNVKSPTYIEDAAAAVAWTFHNIQQYGGSPKRIFVSGHSAGGYLASMIGLDKRWLAAHDIDANDIAGLVPYSGHVITHFTIRAERGILGTQPIIDDLAPLYHVRHDAPPLLLITGDRDKELLGRYEENAYLWRMMREVGHTSTQLHELQGYDHGQMAEPAHPLLLQFIEYVRAWKRQDDAAWTNLFNGRDLDGWVVKCRPRDKDKAGFWKVVDGTITAETPPESDHDYIWLMTEKDYADFELRVKVQTYSSTTGNSGIQIRSRYDDEAGWLDGPQVDINPPGPWRNGFIYDETRGAQIWLWPDVGPPANARPDHAPEGWRWFHADQEDVWNDVQIICRGSHITSVVNGVTVADYDGAGRLDDAAHRRWNVGLNGQIGLQIHPGGQLLIRFKDIKLRELDTDLPARSTTNGTN
jgi:acetyl esterase/lipase